MERQPRITPKSQTNRRHFLGSHALHFQQVSAPTWPTRLPNSNDNEKTLKQKTQKLEYQIFPEAIIKIFRYN